MAYVEIDDADVRMTYLDDMRSKRAAGRGIHGRASRKRGIKGSVRFQSDEIINNKSKWKKQNSKVRIFYMNGKLPIINFEDLANYTLEQEIVLLNQYKEDKNIGIDRVVSLWPITKTWINSIFYQYNKAIKRGKNPAEMPAILTNELRKQLKEAKAQVQDKVEEPVEQKEQIQSVSEIHNVPESEKDNDNNDVEETTATHKMVAQGDKLIKRLSGIAQSLDEDWIYEVVVTIKSRRKKA